MSTSTPAMLDPSQQQQPPPMLEPQMLHQDSGRGSVGPVIGVLAVIVVLGAIAVMIGRICSGRSIMGRGQFDFERWIETKCGSCIDGGPDPPPPPPRAVVDTKSNGSAAEAAPAPAPDEVRVNQQPESA